MTPPPIDDDDFPTMRHRPPYFFSPFHKHLAQLYINTLKRHYSDHNRDLALDPIPLPDHHRQRLIGVGANWHDSLRNIKGYLFRCLTVAYGVDRGRRTRRRQEEEDDDDALPTDDDDDDGDDDDAVFTEGDDDGDPDDDDDDALPAGDDDTDDDGHQDPLPNHNGATGSLLVADNDSDDHSYHEQDDDQRAATTATRTLPATSPNEAAATAPRHIRFPSSQSSSSASSCPSVMCIPDPHPPRDPATPYYVKPGERTGWSPPPTASLPASASDRDPALQDVTLIDGRDFLPLPTAKTRWTRYDCSIFIRVPRPKPLGSTDEPVRRTVVQRPIDVDAAYPAAAAADGRGAAPRTSFSTGMDEDAIQRWAHETRRAVKDEADAASCAAASSDVKTEGGEQTEEEDLGVHLPRKEMDIEDVAMPPAVPSCKPEPVDAPIGPPSAVGVAGVKKEEEPDAPPLLTGDAAPALPTSLPAVVKEEKEEDDDKDQKSAFTAPRRPASEYDWEEIAVASVVRRRGVRPTKWECLDQMKIRYATIDI